MKQIKAFEYALGLSEPWQVSEVTFNKKKNQFTIFIDLSTDLHTFCPQCGQPDCKSHKFENRTWKHLRFFQYDTYISSHIPLIDCQKCGSIPISVPWARKG